MARAKMPKQSARQARLPNDKGVQVSTWVPKHLKRTAERYVMAFNNQHLGGRMTVSRLLASLLQAHLQKEGAIAPDDYNY